MASEKDSVERARERRRKAEEELRKAEDRERAALRRAAKTSDSRYQAMADTKKRLEGELHQARIRRSRKETSIKSHMGKIEDRRAEIAAIEPEIAALETQLAKTEADMKAWQPDDDSTERNDG